MLTTNKGKTVRTRVHEIREAGRNTMGVKLIELAKGEKLQDIARVIREDDEDEPVMPPSTDEENNGEDSAGDEAR